SLTGTGTLDVSGATFTATTGTLVLGGNTTFNAGGSETIAAFDPAGFALTLDSTALTITNAVTIDAGGEQMVTQGNDLTLTTAPTMSDGAITSTGGTVAMPAATTLAGGTLAVSGSILSLTGAGTLDVSGATFTATTGTLRLGGDTTLDAGGAETLATLDLADFALTLEATDLTVSNTVTIDDGAERIITQTNSLTLTAAPTMSLGRITSTDGTIAIPAATTIASGIFDVSGSILSLTGAGTLNIPAATLTAATGTLLLGGDTTFNA
ncbi:MAG: hypothetical protein GY842_14510, partial [bacterium]|nr:hypothetical protein [bacterium]